MEKTFISEDYDGLLDQYKHLRKELDVLKQQLYDSTRQSRLNEVLLKEYQSEIDLLQSGNQDEIHKLTAKINQLEEANVNLRLKHCENVSSIENELQKSELENKELRTELDLLKKSIQNEAKLDISTTFNDMLVLRDENELLKESNEELKEAYGLLTAQQLDMEKIVEQYKEEVSQLEESLAVKRNELTESCALVEKLNDDLLCTKNELDNYKIKPLVEGSKGNSLFAEVDDRRVYLQKTITDMKADYIKMKQERSQHLKQISHLRKENSDLQSLRKKDLAQYEADNEMVEDSLKNHLNTLQEIINRQKIELEEKSKPFPETSCVEYKFYQDMIDSKQEEIKSLKEKWSEKSLSTYLITTSLAQANREIRQLRLKIKEMEQLKQDHETDKHDNKKPAVKIPPVCPEAQGHSLPLRKCLKSRDTLKSHDGNDHLVFDVPVEPVTNTFNIFNNRKEKNIFVQKTESEDITNLTLDGEEENAAGALNCQEANVKARENLDAEDKENDLIKPNIIKRGVTFSDDTVDNVSSRVQRRCTQIISVPKKMF